jgi:ABC-type amino acid transport substrate-binding protein
VELLSIQRGIALQVAVASSVACSVQSCFLACDATPAGWHDFAANLAQADARREPAFAQLHQSGTSDGTIRGASHTAIEAAARACRGGDAGAGGVAPGVMAQTAPLLKARPPPSGGGAAGADRGRVSAVQYFDEGVLTGFNVDLARHLPQQLNVACDIQVRPWRNFGGDRPRRG